MHPIKKQYASNVFKIVADFCCQLSDKQRKGVPIVLHVSNNDAKEIIQKIMIALPDKYFYNAKTEWLDDMLSLISQHFILFQAQENIDEEDYIYHLTCFIDELSKTISTRYYS